MASSRSKKSDPSYYGADVIKRPSSDVTSEHDYNLSKQGQEIGGSDWTKEDQAYHEQAASIKKGAVVIDKTGNKMGSTKYKPE